ncbi:MAG: stage II sporulation protein M [Roseburia sp.]
MDKRIARDHNKNYLLLEIDFFLFFLTGIILANIYQSSVANHYGIVNSYFLQQLKQTRIDRADYLFYVLEIRLPVLLGILILGMTSVYAIVHFLYVSWFGVSFGFLVVTSIMNLGLDKVLFILMSVFPHGIFYLLVYVGILHLQWQYHRDTHRRRLREWMVLWILMGMTFLIGVLLEVYISPEICRRLI